jgi:hypothetical protein
VVYTDAVRVAEQQQEQQEEEGEVIEQEGVPAVDFKLLELLHRGEERLSIVTGIGRP